MLLQAHGACSGCHVRVIALLLGGLAAPPALVAQSHAARVEGTVIDSVRARPAAGASVFLTRILPEPSEFRSTVTDDKGRFHFDTVVAGHYTISFATAYLDSLGIDLPARELSIGDAETQRVALTTPSGVTLREAACPGMSLAHGRGAVLGTVTNADTDHPLTTAHIAVSWVELSVDPKTARAITTPRGGEAPVDSGGRYHLCGVPTDTYLQLQVQDRGRAGSVITTSVDDAGGVAVRDLSLSAESTRNMASLDSAAAASSKSSMVAMPRLRGTAIVSGTVRDESGHPLSEAQIRIRNAEGMARSDSAGQFILANQPAGSQLLETRRVGYLLGQVPVELRGGRTADIVVMLHRIVNLDSIRVVARRTIYSDFERRRKEGFGHFFDEKQIEKLHPVAASELFVGGMVPGFEFQGSRLFSTHGKFELSGMGPCDVNVVIDGVFEHQDIDLVDPMNIAAIEAYAGPAGAPIQYDRACGVVVIWTKR